MIAVADYSGPDARSFKYTYYEDLTPEDAISIMEDLKAGKTPRVCPCQPWCMCYGKQPLAMVYVLSVEGLWRMPACQGARDPPCYTVNPVAAQ